VELDFVVARLLELEPVLELVRPGLELLVGFELVGRLVVEFVGSVAGYVRDRLVAPLRFEPLVAQFVAQVVVPTDTSAVVDSSVAGLSVLQSVDSALTAPLARFVAPPALLFDSAGYHSRFSACSAAALLFVGVGSTALVVDTWQCRWQYSAWGSGWNEVEIVVNVV